MPRSNTATPVITPVDRDAVYTRRQVMQLLEWGEDLMQRAQRNGLRFSSRHGRTFISGQALAEYLVGDEAECPAGC